MPDQLRTTDVEDTQTSVSYDVEQVFHRPLLLEWRLSNLKITTSFPLPVIQGYKGKRLVYDQSPFVRSSKVILPPESKTSPKFESALPWPVIPVA